MGRENSSVATTADPDAQPNIEPQTVLSEVQRLDMISGVVVQTGLAVMAAAVTVAATGSVPDEVRTALLAAAGVCLPTTFFACVSLSIDVPLSGLEPLLEIYAAYRKKRWRCRAALCVLTVTIEIVAAVIGVMIAT